MEGYEGLPVVENHGVRTNRDYAGPVKVNERLRTMKARRGIIGKAVPRFEPTFRPGTVSARIVELLNDNVERVWASPELYAQFPDVKITTIRQMLHTLKRSGHIKTAGYGKYKGVLVTRHKRVEWAIDAKAKELDVEPVTIDEGFQLQQVERLCVAVKFDLRLTEDQMPRLKRWMEMAYRYGQRSVTGEDLTTGDHVVKREVRDSAFAEEGSDD